MSQCTNIHYSKKQALVKDKNKETEKEIWKTNEGNINQKSIIKSLGNKLHPETTQRRRTHLFYRQLLQLRQRAGQQPHQEGSGTANNVQHGAWQHRDECVLPGEGVEQRHHRMYAAGQGTNDGRQKNKTRTHTISYLHTHTTMPCRGHTRLN